MTNEQMTNEPLKGKLKETYVATFPDGTLEEPVFLRDDVKSAVEFLRATLSKKAQIGRGTITFKWCEVGDAINAAFPDLFPEVYHRNQSRKRAMALHSQQLAKR